MSSDEQSETYSVAQIRGAFAKHSGKDDWGVPSFYENGLISALRGEYDDPPRARTRDIRHTPESLEAIFDQVVDLVIEWHEADRHTDNCPRSEQDDARERAEERKDTVMQFLAQMLPVTVTS